MHATFGSNLLPSVNFTRNKFNENSRDKEIPSIVDFIHSFNIPKPSKDELVGFAHYQKFSKEFVDEMRE